jgi:hypothetical protein
MKETTRRKILGSKLYPVYRRFRFLLYKRRVQKRRRKQRQFEIKEEKRELRKNLIEQRRNERIQNRAKRKQIKAEEKQQKLEVRQRLKEKRAEEKLLVKKQEELSRQEKKDKKRERRRMIRFIIKKQLKNFIHEIRTFDRHTLKRWFSWLLYVAENKDQRNNFLIISLNSIVLFILSYLSIYILSQLITVWVSLSFDYKTILFYYKIYFNIDTGDWTADSVKILFSIPPLTGLLLGTVYIIFYSSFRNEPGIFKLFFLWGFIHGMVMFFGSLLMGTLLNKGFGWVIAYLYYRDTGKMIFSIISIFSLVSIGAIIAKSFLISGNAYFNNVTKSNRNFLLSSQLVVPAIIGTIVLMIFKIPNDFYFGTTEEMFFDILKLSTILLVIIPAAVTFKSFNEIYFDEDPRKIKLLLPTLLILLILVVGLRIGLSSGIPVGE